MFIKTKDGWKHLSPVTPAKDSEYKPCKALRELAAHEATDFPDKDTRLKAFAKNVLHMRHTGFA